MSSCLSSLPFCTSDKARRRTGVWAVGLVGGRSRVSFFFSNTAQCQSVTFTIGDLGRHGKWRWKLTYRLSKERQNYWPDTPTHFLYLTVLVTRNQTWLLLLGLSIKKNIYIYTLNCSAPCEFLSDINVHLLTFLLSPNIKNMRMMWRGCETPVGFKCKGAKTLLASSPHRLTRKVTSGFLWQDTTKQNGLMNFLIQSTTTILTKRKRFNSYILHILIFLHCCFIKWTQQKA